MWNNRALCNISVREATSTTPLYEVPFKTTPLLSEFSPVTEDEVEKLISSAPTKTCQLDPVPTWLVKDVRGLLTPYLTVLFNVSLSTGCFPMKFKHAVIRPLLKKADLDSSDMKNFRPVSNLPFLSKLLERVVQSRLQEFLDSNGMMPPMQSAYRRFHSTETAVTKVYNDLLLAADKGQMSALCLLDLTAAFDTVDHELLLHRLERQFGLHGVVLAWFASYLSERRFQVYYSGGMSREVFIVCSVPQGSVLGPRLFVLYIADLADEIHQHGVNLHAYADDSQLYMHCHRDDVAASAAHLSQCVVDIGHWMAANRLQMNPAKTELLWAGTKHNVSLLGCHAPTLQLGSDIVTPSNHVRVLGVTISADLSLDQHVSKVCAVGFYRLRQLRRIRKSLDNESTATLVHAFVTSRVDYCNAVYAMSPQTVTNRLQRLLNAAARVVSDTRKYDRGLKTILHDELHWLDVPERIEYKLGVMVYRCLHGQAPRYLADHLIPASDVAPRRRHLRSANRNCLTVPRCRLSTYGCRAFGYAGPTVWNSLPDELRNSDSFVSFERFMKTVLFSRY